MKTSWKNRRDLFNLLGKNLLSDWGCLFDISGSLNIPSIWNETLTFRITTSIIDNRVNFHFFEEFQRASFFYYFINFLSCLQNWWSPPPYLQNMLLFSGKGTPHWKFFSIVRFWVNSYHRVFFNKTFDILANTNTGA